MKKSEPQVLLVSVGGESSLQEILQRRTNLAEAGSVPGMAGRLAWRKFAVMLSEREFPEGHWREALQELQARRTPTPAIAVRRECRAHRLDRRPDNLTGDGSQSLLGIR